MPEFGVFPMTDGVFGTTRNPWNVDRTSGGSSGGTAAAVAAAMVPVGVGNDGGGSVRIPAAACGLFGIKPGTGVVPAGVGPNDWFDMEENGPLATTVEDAALALSVMASKPGLASITAPRSLRIAVSTKSPLKGVRVSHEWKSAALESGTALSETGHEVSLIDPSYPSAAANAFLFRWLAGVARDVEELDRSKLLKRTRGHAAAGRRTRRFVKAEKRDRWRAHYLRFFDRYDVLLTPTLARTPPPAMGWKDKGWLANMRISTLYAPFCALWNMVGFPAASVPAGVSKNGLPLGVQLVGPDGAEALLLGVARQLEQARPWPRHAPI
jgi:amidase